MKFWPSRRLSTKRCAGADHFDAIDRPASHFVIKYADNQSACIPSEGIEIGSARVFDWPIFKLMVAMHDMAAIMTALIIPVVEFPK